MLLPTFLLLGLMPLLLLLQRTQCVQSLSAGERCGGPGSVGQCADGLDCVAISSHSEIAHCQARGCRLFGCNVAFENYCECRTSTDCLASFEFTSYKECQDYLEEKMVPKALPSKDDGQNSQITTGDIMASLRAILQDAINDGNLTLSPKPLPARRRSRPPQIPASSCRASNGSIMIHGENWCPFPLMKCKCHLGTKICERHCKPVYCSDRINGRMGTCDCPYCPGVTDEGRSQIAAILEMPLKEYTANAKFIKEILESLVSASGLSMDDITASQYSPEQTHAVITVHADGPDITEESVLQAIHNQMYGPANELLTVGSLAEYPQKG